MVARSARVGGRHRTATAAVPVPEMSNIMKLGNLSSLVDILRERVVRNAGAGLTRIRCVLARRVATPGPAAVRVDDLPGCSSQRVSILVRAWSPGGPSLVTFDRAIESQDSWSHFHEIARTLAETAGILSESTSEFTVEVRLAS